MKNESAAVYPIVLTTAKDGVTVYIPDFNINTEGYSIANAIEMARDAIGIIGIDMQDDGKVLPKPSELKTVKAESNDIVSLVDIDFNEYRRMNENRTVKKIVRCRAGLILKPKKQI